MRFCCAGNVEAIRVLLKANADVSIPAEGGVTALHAAAELGNLELVQLLLQVTPCSQPYTCILNQICTATAVLYSLTAVMVLATACSSVGLLHTPLQGMQEDRGPFLLLRPISLTLCAAAMFADSCCRKYKPLNLGSVDWSHSLPVWQ